ncbi:MAG: CRISPR-associated protein Cas4, partial [Spirulina sp.]
MQESIPISALNQYTYCPHRFWLMFCAGEFADNEYTLEGTHLHDRVHSTGEESRSDLQQVRGVWLRSHRYGLVGKSDLIERESDRFYPVEYKRGRKGEWDNDALQVCAQALCLEEMTGCAVTTGYVYYAQTHQRQAVEIDTALREEAISTIAAIADLVQSGEVPQPVYSKRCRGCSLYSR